MERRAKVSEHWFGHSASKRLNGWSAEQIGPLRSHLMQLRFLGCHSGNRKRLALEQFVTNAHPVGDHLERASNRRAQKQRRPAPCKTHKSSTEMRLALRCPLQSAFAFDIFFFFFFLHF